MTRNQIGIEMLDILMAAAIAVSSPQLAPVDDTTTITIQEDGSALGLPHDGQQRVRRG